MKTRITDLYGIKYPIISGGMMWVSRAELVAAVGNAGGIGFLTALTHREPEALRDEIKKTRDLTDKPFGVNLTFLPTLIPVNYDIYLDIIIDEGISFIETAGRNPEPHIDRLKSADMKVIHKCTSVRHAIKAETIGCDAVSIDGFECAGHPGEDDVTSLILIPLTADAISVPIIASGGFGDGRGLAGALALGAEGINMGTRFLATQEAPVHDAVKQALVNASERDTRLIMRTLRNTERVLDNSVVQKVLEIEARGNAQIGDIAPYVAGGGGLKLLQSGQTDAGILSIGQIIGLIRNVPTCAELINTIMTDAEKIITDRLARMCNGT